MSKIKEFLKRKKVGFYFSCIACFILFISFFAYILGANDATGYSPLVIILYILSLGINLLYLYKDKFGVGSILVGISEGLIFGFFIQTRFVYFATGLLGISADGINPAVLFSLMFILLAMIVNNISANMNQDVIA